MTTHAIAPHTRIDNSIIDDLASQIGIYGLGIYVAIKRHLNQKTGDCFPSYKTIAKKLHIDRGTVIRYVKKLKAFNLLDPKLRFKEDGSPTSNQYNFDLSADRQDKGGCTKQPEVVVLDNQPGGTKPPEQSPLPNKKERTISDVDFFAEKFPQDPHKSLINSHIPPSAIMERLQPTEKQRTCPHPPTEIVFLAEHVTICHHCYGLLDENLNLQEEESMSSPYSIGIQSEEILPEEIVAA
jgi:Helix-turn-helix domain